MKYSLRDLRGDLLRVLLMGAAAGLLGALVPIVTKQIVDIAIPQAEGGLAVALALGLVVAAISAMLFEVARQFAVLRIETKLDAGLQAAVWDRLLSLPAPFFRDYSAGDLAVRAMGINTIRQMVTGATIIVAPFGRVLRLQLRRDLLLQRATGADSHADGGDHHRGHRSPAATCSCAISAGRPRCWGRCRASCCRC